MSNQAGIFRTKTISRGKIICANGFFLESKKHEIVKGDEIYWVEKVNRNGVKRLYGYCGWCYTEVYN